MGFLCVRLIQGLLGSGGALFVQLSPRALSLSHTPLGTPVTLSPTEALPRGFAHCIQDLHYSHRFLLYSRNAVSTAHDIAQASSVHSCSFVVALLVGHHYLMVSVTVFRHPGLGVLTTADLCFF